MCNIIFFRLEILSGKITTTIFRSITPKWKQTSDYKIMSSAGAPTPSGTSMHHIKKILHTWSVKLNNGHIGMEHLRLIMVGSFMAYNEWGIYGLRVWLWLKWVGQLWQSKLLFRLEVCSKNAGLQGSTLSDHRMTTGFGPFELPSIGQYWVVKLYPAISVCLPIAFCEDGYSCIRIKMTDTRPDQMLIFIFQPHPLPACKYCRKEDGVRGRSH